MILLDDPEDVKQLLWARNSIYCQRMDIPMIKM
jgi:hypothetical protein